jgi:hypothetical protein
VILKIKIKGTLLHPQKERTLNFQPKCIFRCHIANAVCWKQLLYMASPRVLRMWPCKIFSFFQPNPSHKIKTGTANRWGQLIANHLNNEQLSNHIYYSSLSGVRHCCTIYKCRQTVQKCWAKTILQSLTNMFWLFFKVTGGVALS